MSSSDSRKTSMKTTHAEDLPNRFQWAMVRAFPLALARRGWCLCAGLVAGSDHPRGTGGGRGEGVGAAGPALALRTPEHDFVGHRVRPAGDHRRRYVVFWLGVSGLGWITFPICTSQGLSSLIGVGKSPGDKQADAAYQQDASYQDLHRLVAGSEIRNAWTFLTRGGRRGCVRVCHGLWACRFL